jgi:P pilus assembly chaperone PapD
MKLRHVSLLIALLAFSATIARAQVTISPTAVFLDKNSKVGSFYVSNPSNSAVEVRLSFEFAYPSTDETGRVYLNYEDQEAEERFSLVPFLRAFPTTFVLQPDQRQTIRLVGRVPQNSDPGMYWTRMRVSSNQLTPPIGDVDEGQVSAQVSFQIDQVTSVLVQHGNVNTGLQINGSTATLDNGQLIVLTNVDRTGNAPFIGSVRTQILNSRNEEVNSRRSSTSVYFSSLQRVEFDVSTLPAGVYTVITTFESSRNDIASQNLIQIPEVSERTTFTIE